MKIRRATEQDAERVRELIIELNKTRDSPKVGGFLEYPIPSRESLKLRIHDNPLFYVADSNSGIVGFSSAYNHRDLRELDFLDDEIAQHLLGKNAPFIYLEMIGIAGEHQGKGIGVRLFDHFLQNRPPFGNLWTTVAHFPVRNNQSIRIAESRGFELDDEIQVYSGLKFGIYRKD